MVSTSLYNEIDPFASAWLENLIAAGHIAPGRVDRRSIKNLVPADLDGIVQAHFFAGIGVWSYALRLAGWPDDVPVWTGSCPCQGWSQAGKQKGFEDDRHLWPAWFELIRKCRPPVIFGEQVASPLALAWLDTVQDDLEGAGYAVGAADLCAAGIGAPHLRQRLYFAGIRRDLADGMFTRRTERRTESGRGSVAGSSRAGIMADDDDGFREQRGQGLSTDRDASCGDDLNGRGATNDGAVGNTNRDGIMRNAGTAHRTKTAIECSTPGRSSDGPLGDGLAVAGRSLSLSPEPPRNAWEPCDWIPCRDGKWRPVEPGTFPLAHGAPARVGRLRGYGNALCAPLAAEFVRSVMDVLGC